MIISFSKHIDGVVSRASQMCGWILRTFRTREKVPMLTLWKSLVRSNIDYCCQLWNPSKVGQVQAVEQVQRSFIRKICGMQQLSYWDQLSALSLYSLERRRERYIVLYVWRILEGLTPNFSEPNAGGISATWNACRGRLCKVPAVSRRASAASQRIRYSSFGITGPRLFNSLPIKLRNLTGCDLVVFKKKLDIFLQTVPDEPLVPGYTAYQRADSNCLIHMVQLADSQLVVRRNPDSASLAGGGQPWPPRG